MKVLALIVLGALLSGPVPAQESHLYSVGFSGVLTTSSKLFRHPNDADIVTRSEYLPLNAIFGMAIDLRRSIESLRLQIGLSVEFLQKSDVRLEEVSGSNGSTLIPISDGFTAVPVELSGYFVIPIGSEKARLYMGGGGGVYFGSRDYRYAGISAEAVDRKTGYGIHVLSGFEYFIKQSVSLRTELKFRDVQFETVNAFRQPSANYRGVSVNLDPAPFPSRINVDGMILSLGLAYSF